MQRSDRPEPAEMPDVDRLNLLLKRRARLRALWQDVTAEIKAIMDQIEQDHTPERAEGVDLTVDSLPAPPYVRRSNSWSTQTLRNKEFVLSLFGKHDELPTQYLRDRWEQAGRPGRVDNVLWQLRKDGALWKASHHAVNRLTRKGKARAAEVLQSVDTP